MDKSPSGDWTRVLFEAIDDAVFVHDAQGRILEANPAACRRLGYSRDEMLMLTMRDIDAPEQGHDFEERLQRQFKEGFLRFEGIHRTKHGKRIPVDVNTAAIRLDGVPAVLAVVRDMTERKRREDALDRHSRLVQTVLNNMGEAILVIDAQDSVLLSNSLAQDLFGLGEAKGPTPLLRSEQGVPLTVTPAARCLAGEAFDDLEVFAPAGVSGRGRWLQISGRPLRAENPHSAARIQAAILVARDITTRRRHERLQDMHYAATRALAEDRPLNETARAILRVLGEGLRLDVGVLWVVPPDGQQLECAEFWNAPGLDFPEFRVLTRRIALERGDDLPGQTWELGGPLMIPLRVWEQDAYNRPSVAWREGLRHACGYPILAAGNVVGVLEFLAREQLEADDDLDSLMRALGSQIGQVLQRHHTERALRDSEALYQSLVNSLPQNIFRKDRAGRVTFANQRYCATLHRPLTELLGKTDFDLFPRELAAKYVQDDRKILETGETFEAIEQHHLPEGDDIYVQVVKTPVYDANGDIVGVQGIFWDVTARKRTEEILANSERRYRQLTEATLDAIVLVDQLGKIVLFNPAAEKLFGYHATEVLGRNVDVLMPPEMRDAHHRGFERYLATRLARIIGKPQELTALRKDGATFPVEVALSVLGPQSTTTRGPIQFLAAIRDLTERNKMRSVLVHNEKLASIGLLSAGVAHEINNPLAFVGNNLAVLKRDSKGILALIDLLESAGPTLAAAVPDFWQRYQALADETDLPYLRDNLERLLDRSRDGVDRVTRIIHSLRGMARTDAPTRQLVDLPDLIDSSLEILRGRYRRIGVEVTQEHDPSPRVYGVATQLSQVILNLLVNAYQALESASTPNAAIHIRTQRRGDNLFLEIRDNGPGIRPEHLPRIFDPFFTTKEVGEGTGLGLSISHNIIAAHGGAIDVESAPGQGACFRITLPTGDERSLR